MAVKIIQKISETGGFDPTKLLILHIKVYFSKRPFQTFFNTIPVDFWHYLQLFCRFWSENVLVSWSFPLLRSGMRRFTLTVQRSWPFTVPWPFAWSSLSVLRKHSYKNGHKTVGCASKTKEQLCEWIVKKIEKKCSDGSDHSIYITPRNRR